nr:cob(I)yrinic acid a,c-diamide adenosyltransferase [Dorea sp. AM58-8]
MLGTGLVHIYYGDGKGKTTAAMGQAIRAAGSGLKVLVFQFMKDNSSSERKALEMIPNITLLPGKRHTKFYNQMNSEEKAEYRHYNTKHSMRLPNSASTSMYWLWMKQSVQ